MQTVRVIAGLGNPGPRYDGTRHNIGFDAVTGLSARHGGIWKEETRFCAQTATIVVDDRPVLLLKPQTFMNLSGKAISAVCRFYKWTPEAVLVVYDEVQLPLGSLKVSLTGGDGGHNGLADILQRMGRRFPRLRLGIGSKPHPEMSLTDYVLGRWTADERPLLTQSLEQAPAAMESIVRQGPLLASNTLNQKSPQTKHERPSKPQIQPNRDSRQPGLRSPGGAVGDENDRTAE